METDEMSSKQMTEEVRSWERKKNHKQKDYIFM